jgi:hypothetical protein
MWRKPRRELPGHPRRRCRPSEECFRAGRHGDQPLREDRCEDALLGGKVVVEGLGTELEAGSNFPDGGFGVALLMEESLGSLEDSPAGAALPLFTESHVASYWKNSNLMHHPIA